MGRIMAIDYGKKRCGIAVTDPMRIFASGLCTVSNGELYDFVTEYIEREQVDILVMGIPYRADGTIGHLARDIEALMDRINKKFPDLKLDGIDESHSSSQAVHAMISGGVPKKKRREKGLIDKVSATLILQRYLEENTL